MTWVLLKSLDDHVLFLCSNMDVLDCRKCYSTSTACCSAANMGLERGCLFYTPLEDQTLYTFELEDNATTVIMPCLQLPTLWFLPTWIMMPTTKNRHLAGRRRKITDLLVSQDTTETSIEEENMAKVTNRGEELKQWDFLNYNDSTEEIARFLHPVDYIHFRLACATIRFSKDGWLLLSNGKKAVFCYNPFTRAIICLPDLPDDYVLGGMSFSSVPTSPDCVVIAVSIWFDFVGYDTIYFLVIEPGKGLLYANKPILFDRAFYCLDYNGMLGVFNMTDDSSWEILPKSLKQFSGFYPSYLVECDKMLLLVNLGQSGKYVDIYRSDHTEMVW
ncbi:hypothetical protein MKW98_029283, partial [Papaver atlanticum]